MADIKRIVKGGELVFFPLNLPDESGWGCGVLSGFVPETREIVVSYGDCERTLSGRGCAMASQSSFHTEAGYLVGRVFKDEKEIAKALLPLLKRPS